MSDFHDRMKQKIAGARAGFGWKTKDGDNKIVVLPPAARFVDNLDAVDSPYFQYHGHYLKVEGQQGMDVSRCLRDLGQVCPACVAFTAFKGNADPGLAEMAKQVRAATLYLFNIIDINDPQKGVQRWAANYTCWAAIMAYIANPAWGFIFDPRNAVPFVVTLVPKGKSKSGYNTYSVQPEPGRLNVYDLLLSKEGGLAALDGLEEQTMEVKSAEEIQKILVVMGLPVMVAGAPAVGPSVATPGVVANAPLVVGTPLPMTVPATPAAPVAVPTTPVVGPRPVSMAAPVAQPTAQPIGFRAPLVVHYDPGPAYQPVVPDHERPEGAPRCFGDYNPGKHRCEPCKSKSPCQMKMLGVAP